MAQIFPFRAIVPEPAAAAAVAAPPYDVVSAAEAASLAAGNPLSFLRVSRAEIDLPAETDHYSPAVYHQAAAAYARIKREAPLRQTPLPCFHIYSLVMNGRRQTGIGAVFSVDEYDGNIIKKHEKTRKDKEDDRTRHILELRAQTGPVFLTCRPSAELDGIIQTTLATPPHIDFTTPDGIRHSLWRIDDPAASARIQAAFAATPALYIADGHHRAASAARVRETLRGTNSGHTGSEEYNRFLAVCFPANQLKILPYNRVVRDLNGLTAKQMLEECGRRFAVTPAAGPTPARSGLIHMFLDGAWWALDAGGPAAAAITPLDQLDVSLLQNHLLAPVLGIADPRTSSRLDFIGGIRGTQVLEDKVRQGEAAVAFSMYPTTVEQLMAISDAGGIMPPKSTWFEPKLRDGLLCHDL